MKRGAVDRESGSILTTQSLIAPVELRNVHGMLWIQRTTTASLRVLAGVVLLSLCFLAGLSGLADPDPNLTIDKTVVVTSCNNYETTLTLIGDPPLRPIDVILVIDRSTSMGYGSPSSMTYSKQAAVEFATKILTEGCCCSVPGYDNKADCEANLGVWTTQNQVGLASYGNSGTLNQALTDDLSTITTAINALQPGGTWWNVQYTNIEAGFITANTEMSNNGRDPATTTRAVVLMSDGVANRRVGGSNCTDWPTSHTPCTNEAWQAGVATWPNADVYTVGLLGYVHDNYPDSLSVAQETLNWAQNSGYFETLAGPDLTSLYEGIAETLLAAGANLVVVETVTSLTFDIDPISAYTKRDGTAEPVGTFTIDEDGFTWDIAQIGKETLEIVFTTAVDGDYCTSSGSGTHSVSPNASASVTYDMANGNPNTMDFPDPGSVPVVCILVDITADRAASCASGCCSNPAYSTQQDCEDGGGTWSGDCPYALNATVTGGTPAYTYAWSDDAGGSFSADNIEDPSWTPPGGFTGTARLTLQVTDSVGCEARAAISYVDVEVFGNPPCTLTCSPNCTNTGPVPLTADSGYDHYSWERDGSPIAGSTNTLVATASGTYSVLIGQDHALSSGGTITCYTRCEATVTVLSPSIDVGKSAAPDTVPPDTDVTFTITVVNTGDTTLDPVVIVDTLPTGMGFVSASDGGVESPTGTVTWTLGAMASSATRTLTLVAHVDPVISGCSIDTLTNSVTATGTPPVGSDVSDTDTSDVSVTDNEPPIITCPPAVSVQCPGNVPAVDTDAVSVSDNCSAEEDIIVRHISDVSDGLTCPETITRTYEAEDESGNTAQCTQTITVNDTTDPTWDQSMPADTTVECDSVPDPPTVTASDNCDTAVQVDYDETRTDGACPDSYTLTRTWTATDNCTNSITHTQTITVQDTTDPTFDNCPADVTVECDAVPAAASPTASDNCDDSVDVTYNGEVRTDGACPDSYTLTRTWTATDDCDNSTTCTQVITVQDTTPPVITCPANITTCNDPGLCSAVLDPGTATATDNCDPSPTVKGTRNDDRPLTDAYPCGITTITWTATDNCNNSASCVQIIEVEDCDPPIISGLSEKPLPIRGSPLILASIGWMILLIRRLKSSDKEVER